MFSRQTFAEKLRACHNGELSLADFEEWFADASWNVHQLKDPVLTDAVFRVESLWSAFDSDRLSERDTLVRFGELANAIRPFVQLQIVARSSAVSQVFPDGLDYSEASGVV